jgi:putative transposase
MTGEVDLRLRELIREICGHHDVAIIRGHVSKDHVHLFVSVSPWVPVSRLVQAPEGMSSFKLTHLGARMLLRVERECD